MSTEALLSRLEGVRRTASGRWIARCPAHDDRHPSLSLRELEDGRVLVHCFSGCDVESVLAAVGLDFDVLFPEKALDYRKARARQLFSSTDALRCVAFEALVVAVGAGSLEKGEPLSEVNRARLMLAAERLQTAAEVACDA